MTDRLQAGTILYTNSGGLQSPNGQYHLEMQTDGNLVLYKGTKSLWASGTKGNAQTCLALEGDGNLSLYGLTGGALPGLPARWQTNTHPGAGTWLQVQNDGNCVLYDAHKNPKWSTNTAQSSGFQVPSIHDAANGFVTGLKVGLGISSTEAAIRAAVGAFKSKGDVGKNILGGIAGSVVVGIVAPIGDVARTMPQVVNPKVSRFTDAYQKAAIEDPANSLKVDVGIVGVVAGVVTVNPVAIAAGGASIALGAAGLADDACKDLAKQDAASRAAVPAPAPTPIPDVAQVVANPIPPPLPSPTPVASSQQPSAVQANLANKKLKPPKVGFFRRIENWLVNEL